MFERWEEHQHHTENVQLINAKQKQIDFMKKYGMPTPVSKPVMSRLSDFIMRRSDKRETPTPPPAPVFSMNKMFVPQYSTGTQDPQPMLIPHGPTVNTVPVADTNFSSRPGLSLSDQQGTKPSLIHVPINTAEMNKMPLSGTGALSSPESTPVTRNVNNWFTKNDLRRRPLRTYESREPAQYSFSSTRSNIRQKFLSAFGFSEKHDKPAGLRNEGQNLCFMNCVIQCLSHTPGLVNCLFDESSQELDCSETESAMISALTEILSQCQRTKNEGCLDPSLFREAVSLLNGGLVAPLSERQHQQDAAEFYMWLMEVLHGALNKKTVPGK